MVVGINIVVTCSRAKRWSPEDYLSLRNSRTSSVGERFALWVQSIDQANKENVPTLPAREMYSGATWHVAKRLNTVAKNQGFESTAWIISAGYGLIGEKVQLFGNYKKLSKTLKSCSIPMGETQKYPKKRKTQILKMAHIVQVFKDICNG